jgi:hypothetical protein
VGSSIRSRHWDEWDSVCFPICSIFEYGRCGAAYGGSIVFRKVSAKSHMVVQGSIGLIKKLIEYMHKKIIGTVGRQSESNA